jgi:hypothetical protein
MAYKNLTDSKPATMATMRNTAVTVAEAKLEGIKDMVKFFKHLLFLTGLYDTIHDKILDARLDTFAQSLELACEFEAIQLNHKCSQRIAVVKTELQPEDANTIAWETLMEEEFKQVDKFRLETTGFCPRRTTRGQLARVPLTALVIPTYLVATARRRATCRRSVTPIAETILPWWMPMASLMRTTVTTTWLKRRTSSIKSMMPRWGPLLTSAHITI